MEPRGSLSLPDPPDNSDTFKGGIGVKEATYALPNTDTYSTDMHCVGEGSENAWRKTFWTLYTNSSRFSAPCC